MARIICITSHKGGAGKSTLTMHLAVALQRDGYRVLIADGDESGMAQRWAAQSPDERPFPVPVIGLANHGAKLHRELANYNDIYDYILIDTPPSVSSPVPQSGMLVADLVLIPARPSLADLYGLQDTLALVEKARVVNDGLRAVAVINAAQYGTRLSVEIVDVLDQLGIERLDTTIHQRQVYAQAIAAGGTALDQPGPARAEIEHLMLEVVQILEAA